MNNSFRMKPPKATPLIINDIQYRSCRHAAELLGMSVTVVANHFKKLKESPRTEMEFLIQTRKRWTFKEVKNGE